MLDLAQVLDPGQVLGLGLANCLLHLMAPGQECYRHQFHRRLHLMAPGRARELGWVQQLGCYRKRCRRLA